MARLCSGDLSPDQFIKLVQEHAWPQDALLLAFTPFAARFERFEPDVSFLSRTEQGRVFSEKGELLWRRLDGKVRAVYLGESPPEGLQDFSSELEGLSSSTRQLLLWGVRTETEDEWLEQQVPHRFSYPVDTAEFACGRVALTVEDWKDAAGIPRFSRYRGIIEVKGETRHAPR